MALYELQGPDGKMYEIEAPDVQSAATAFQEMAKPKAPASQPQLTAGETAMDIAKSAGIGVVQGGIGLATLPGNLEYLGRAGIDKAATMLGYEDPQTSSNTLLPTYSDAKQFAEGYTGEFYKPQTTAGEYARTIGEFAPLAALGPGGAAARATNVLAPAVASETAGQLTEGSKYEPYARAAGALAGGMLPTVGMRTITPVGGDAAKAAHVQALEREGVTALTAGQKSGNKALRWAEAVAADTPGAAKKAELINTQAAEQFTAAALKRAGVSANRATPDVINTAFDTLGKQFDDIASRNFMKVDGQLRKELTDALRAYTDLVPPSQQAPFINRIVKDIGNTSPGTGGGIAGDVYQALRSRVEMLRRGAARDPQVSSALGGVRDALDNAMQRSVAPKDAKQWRTIRTQYRNLLTIEKAAAGAGENAALGLISPAQLRTAAKTQNARAYSRGKSDLGNLGRSGEAVMKPLPQSGTAPRAAFNDMFAAGGAATGAMFGGAPGAAVGAIAGPIVRGGTARAVLSRPVQNYFSNRVMDDAINAYEQARPNALFRAPFAATEIERGRGISGGMGPQYDEYGNPLPDSLAEQELMRRRGAF